MFNQEWLCELCHARVMKPKFRFCRRCEIQITPVHECPSCGTPCRGRQCRACHKKMFQSRFCTSDGCYGWRAPRAALCRHCTEQLAEEAEPEQFAAEEVEPEQLAPEAIEGPQRHESEAVIVDA